MKSASLATIALTALVGPALAQAPSDHQQHHPGGTPAPQTQVQPPPSTPALPQTPTQPQGQMPMMGQMMQNMPEQCRAMMQAMPQSCMGMMQQMTHGGTLGGGMQGQGIQATPSQAGAQSEATKAYMKATDKMHGPMMQGIGDPDPDVAFVKGMIPHHQSAIDMAKVVLQHGKDEQTKKWANDVVREQEREIGEMQGWLKAKGKL
jgi:uncharacterized protein (DUF305 family)